MGSSVLAWVFKGPWDFTFLYWFCLYTASYTIFLFLLIVCQWVLGTWSHQAKELAFIFLAYYVPNSPSPAYLLVGVCVGHKPMLLFSGASQFYFVRQGISLTQESTFGYIGYPGSPWDPPMSDAQCFGYRYMSQDPAFSWALGLKTHVLILTQKGFHPLSHSQSRKMCT